MNGRRIAGIVVAAALIGSCALPPPVSAASRYVRDWQVERPLAAGVLKGLTLGAFPSTRFGAGGAAASPYDPYGMSAAVHAEVTRLATPQQRAGLALGAGWWLFVIGGVIHRSVHTLLMRRMEHDDAR